MTDTPFDRLAQTVVPGSSVQRSWPLTGGISAVMTALELQGPDGQPRRLVVRQPGEGALKNNPQAAANEFRVLQLLREAGAAAPVPVLLDEAGPVAYLVMEYIEGNPDFTPANVEDYSRQLAEQLAKIHRVDCSRADCAFLPPAEQALAWQLERRPALDLTLEEARIRETLTAAWPIPPRNPPTLLHGDYWPGNVLWQAGQLVAVVDWEDAMFGDPLFDLSVARLDLLWIFGLNAMTGFTQHYLAGTGVDITNLPYWDLFAALRLARMAGGKFAEWAAFFHPFGRDDITEDIMRGQYGYFVAQAFQKLPV